MYPSRAAARHPWPLVAVVEGPDCDRGDRGALRDSAGVGAARPASGRHARASRTDPGSTADHGCTVRKAPEEHRNARSVAQLRAGASETNSEKLAAARASTILRAPCCASLEGMLAQQPEGSERLTPGLRPMGWAIVPGVAPSGRISGRDRLPAGPVEVVPDQAGGSILGWRSVVSLGGTKPLPLPRPSGLDCSRAAR